VDYLFRRWQSRAKWEHRLHIITQKDDFPLQILEKMEPKRAKT
jgi:hypothetical protein